MSPVSAAVRLTVTCGCGTDGSMSLSAAPGQGRWTCPSCRASWQPDRPSAERAEALVRSLRWLRVLAIGIPVVVGVLFALLAIWRPSLIMTVPLAVGLVMVVLRRPYRARLLAIYRQLSVFTLVRTP